MTPELKIQLQDFSKQYKNYEKYIREANWVEDYDIEGSYETEQGIVDNILRDLKNFLKENSTSLHYKEVQTFFKLCTKISDIHITRIDEYLKKNDWSKRFKDERDELVGKMRSLEEDGITDEVREFYNELKRLLSDLESAKRKEINFQKNLFSHKTKTRVGILELNIDSENNTLSPHLFHSNKKASLIMRPFLYDKNTHLREKTDQIEINWESPNPATSKELYINMNPKDIPPYDERKHFFEQPLSTIQFWEEEIRKIKYGINLGGYELSAFLYYAFNFGVIPQGTEQDKVTTKVKFRDNEYFFDESLKEAKEKGYEALIMYGTRRFGKSGLESLYLSHGMATISNCSGNLIGFSTKDLGEVLNYFNIEIINLPPALRPIIDVNDQTDKITFGVKISAQEKYEMSKLAILNLDGGVKKNSSQKPAGGTPDRVVFDEIGKGDALKPYLALRPALAGGAGGKPRTIVIMAGTAGEDVLSASAETMLKNTEAYGILPMNWDLLEKISDPEHITWTHKKFATFVPAQMSLYIDKKETNLKDFIKSDNPELSKIPMQETDWKTGKEFFENRRKLATSDYKAMSSEISSHPLDSDDIYLSGDKNKFNAIGMKAHKQWLIDKEKTGKKVYFNIDYDGNITTELTNDPIVTDYPFRGGTFTAPVLMFEELEEEPPFGLYTIGIDDVKHHKSDGDSLLSLTVYKRGWELSEWANRIVCTYATRPERKEEAYKVMYLIMKYYNAIVFPENEDQGFIDFVERRHKSDAMKHLAEGVNFARSLDLDSNRNRDIGFAATIKNINRLNSRVLAYTQEPIDDNSELDGFTQINDIMLLEEMINNKPGANADRIRSFGLALIYAEYLDKNNLYIARRRFYNNDENKIKQKPKLNRGFGSTFKGLKKGF